MYKVDLIVKPRPGVRDPQGEAVEEALHGIGQRAAKVRGVGRYLHLEIDAADAAAAERAVEDMCRRLLVNPNLETYEITVRP